MTEGISPVEANDRLQVFQVGIDSVFFNLQYFAAHISKLIHRDHFCIISLSVWPEQIMYVFLGILLPLE